MSDLDDIETQFQIALFSLSLDADGWRKDWAKALRMLAKGYHRPATELRGENPIAKALRALAGMFDDLEAGIASPLATAAPHHGRPRLNRYQRSQRLWFAIVAGIELETGRRLGREPAASFQAAVQSIRQRLRELEQPHEPVSVSELRSAWGNRNRFTDHEKVLLEKMVGAAKTPAGRARVIPPMVQLAALSKISKVPVF